MNSRAQDSQTARSRCMCAAKTGPSTNSPIARQAGLQSSTRLLPQQPHREGVRQLHPARQQKAVHADLSREPGEGDGGRERGEKIDEQKGIIKILPELKRLHKPMEDRTISEVYEGFLGCRWCSTKSSTAFGEMTLIESLRHRTSP